MPKQDFTDYEQRLAADHEHQCRALLTIHLAWTVCSIRKCRRDRACSGPMLVSTHQRGKVRVQKEIGLSGHACAGLPACMARASDAAFETFETIRGEWQAYQLAHPQDRLPKFDRCLKAGRSPQAPPGP